MLTATLLSSLLFFLFAPQFNNRKKRWQPFHAVIAFSTEYDGNGFSGVTPSRKPEQLFKPVVQEKLRVLETELCRWPAGWSCTTQRLWSQMADVRKSRRDQLDWTCWHHLWSFQDRHEGTITSAALSCSITCIYHPCSEKKITFITVYKKASIPSKEILPYYPNILLGDTLLQL